MSPSYALTSMLVKFGKKPALTLLICKKLQQLHNMLKAIKADRKMLVLYDEQKIDLAKTIMEQKIELVVMSTYKSSIMCALDEVPRIFSLLINMNFICDLEYYQKINQFISKDGGSMISFIHHEKDIHKIEKLARIKLQKLNLNLTKQEIEKEVYSQAQFAPKPRQQTVSLVKMLPFSPEQISARFFQLLQKQFQFKKSQHLQLPGYVTYQIHTDVQFSSIKYIWNFLREYLEEEVMKEIKGMHRMANGKGVVFDAPQSMINEFLDVIKKHSHVRKKDKRYQLGFVSVMPELEDTTSNCYKEKQQKKEYAFKHKGELQIFIGGLPHHAEETEIRTFFQKKQVHFLTIRIMRDNQGFSKGMCFALCLDRQNLQRALNLAEIKFGDKNLRISLAEKKDRKF